MRTFMESIRRGFWRWRWRAGSTSPKAVEAVWDELNIDAEPLLKLVLAKIKTHDESQLDAAIQTAFEGFQEALERPQIERNRRALRLFQQLQEKSHAFVSAAGTDVIDTVLQKGDLR